MKTPFLFLAFLSLIFLCGCWVYSVEPLYDNAPSVSDPDLTFDQNLVGSWAQLQDDCLWILSITADGREYQMKMAPAPECKSDEKPSKYTARLVKLGNSSFLDVLPDSDGVCDLCLPLHTFLLVSLQNDDLAFTPLDRDWLVQAMTEKKVTLAHLEHPGKYDPVTLTASSKELKEVVRKYADDRAAFNTGSDHKLKFKKR